MKDEPPEPAVTFHAASPSNMPPTLAARVRRHFTALKLAKLYGPQAWPELRTLGYSLRRMHHKAVPGHLTERAEGWRSENPNCWRPPCTAP